MLRKVTCPVLRRAATTWLLLVKSLLVTSIHGTSQTRPAMPEITNISRQSNDTISQAAIGAPMATPILLPMAKMPTAVPACVSGMLRRIQR